MAAQRRQTSSNKLRLEGRSIRDLTALRAAVAAQVEHFTYHDTTEQIITYTAVLNEIDLALEKASQATEDYAVPTEIVSIQVICPTCKNYCHNLDDGSTIILYHQDMVRCLQCQVLLKIPEGAFVKRAVGQDAD